MNEHSELGLSAFRAWLNAAKPGERFGYYFGDLSSDCDSSLKGKKSVAARELRRGVWDAWTGGLVVLVQRVTQVQHHRGGRCFEYLAVRIAPPRRHRLTIGEFLAQVPGG